MGAERNRDQADGILPPVPRLVAAKKIDVDQWFGVLRTIVGPEREDRRRGSAPDKNAAPLGDPVRYPELSKILGQQFVERRCLRGVKRHERVVRCLSNRGLDGSARVDARDAGITLVSAGNRVDRIEDRDVDNRRGPTRAARAQLFMKHPVLARCRRRVVESAGVNRDPVPIQHLAQRIRAAR